MVILYIFGIRCVYVSTSICMFVIIGQMAGPIRTKLDVPIQLDPWIVLGKSRSRSRPERHKRDNGAP